MKNKEFKRRFLALMMASVLTVGMMSMQSVVFAEEATEEATEEASETELGIKYAELYNIEYLENDVKLVTDGDGNQILLVPEEAEVPEGYDAMVVTTPIKHAIFTSTTHIGLLGALNDESLYDTIAAVTTDKDSWTTPQIVERMESGTIAYVAQDHWTAGNIEEIVEIEPDVVFVSGGDEAAVQLCAQLKEVGIPYIVIAEWMESTGEGQLEWLKLFGACYNLDEETDAIFEGKLERMAELKDLTAEIAEEDRPVVVLGMVYDGIVYTQGADSTTAKNIEAAGGVYALSDLEGEGSVQIGMEEFVEQAKDADILIYSSLITYSPDKVYLEGMEPLLAEFNAFKNDTIYVYGQGYYMNSAAVDEKFEDLVAIIHPELMEDYELLHYVKLPDAAE